MNRPSVEAFSRKLGEETVASVRKASASKIEARRVMLDDVFENLEAARTQAAQVKDYVLDNLATLLPQLELKCSLNGIEVHWAKDGVSANRIIADICKNASPSGGTIVKAKSMATEEIHLNKHLIEAGYRLSKRTWASTSFRSTATLRATSSLRSFTRIGSRWPKVLSGRA